MDLDDIRLFVKVAELKSFVAAAKELRIQTSLLSRSIARLEASLGTRLLHRTTRKVSLTEEGQQFLQETSRGLEAIHSAVDSLNSTHGKARGKLRITSPIEIGQLLIENALPGFFEAYPEVQMEWDFLAGQKSPLESNADLSIRADHSIEQSLIEKRIGSLTVHAFKSPAFPLAIGKKPTLKELEGLPWIIYNRGPLVTNQSKVQLMIEGTLVEIYPRNVRFRTNSLVSVRQLILQGLGIGLLPGPLSDPDIAVGKLTPVLPNYLKGQEINFYAVYPTREYLAPKVRVLIDWLVNHFPKNQSKHK